MGGESLLRDGRTAAARVEALRLRRLDAAQLAAGAVAADGLRAAASGAVVLVAEEDRCVRGGGGREGREGEEDLGELHFSFWCF